MPALLLERIAGPSVANQRDPWTESGKYARAWSYFAVVLLALTTLWRWFQFWNDRVRTAAHTDAVEAEIEKMVSGSREPTQSDQRSETFATAGISYRPFNIILAVFRWFTYRPLPTVKVTKNWTIAPSLSTILLVFAATVFVLLFCFLPRPLYRPDIRFGSPPLAIRAGMLAVATIPWIVALGTKGNLISYMTGIGHERLNVLHRWLAYICLLLSLIHMIPFYVTPIWSSQASITTFKSFIKPGNFYYYGTGLACIVPLFFLSLHSFAPLRRRFYEGFRVLHVPVSIVFVGMLFWHCKNYLSSWSYLFATIGVWTISWLIRVWSLNWSSPTRISFLVGEESAITVLPENGVKITIPTRMRWRPGQFVYIRMPAVELWGSHPFTIASLWDEDMPSEYGEEFRDMILVFRPWAGFTRKVLDTALDHGPWHTYQAFLDGPYGGMRRQLASFDHVILIAGGSGITAIVSYLLDLVKRLRTGRAVAQNVELIWTMKRPETMEWFREELRTCKEFAPIGSVSCRFYITGATRATAVATPTRPLSVLHDRVNGVFQQIAENRYMAQSNPTSARSRPTSFLSQRSGRHLSPEAARRVSPSPSQFLHPESARNITPQTQATRRANSNSSHGSQPQPQPSTNEPPALEVNRPRPKSELLSPPSSAITNQKRSHRYSLPLPRAASPSNHTSTNNNKRRRSSRSSSLSIITSTPHLPPHPTLHERRRARPNSIDITLAQGPLPAERPTELYNGGLAFPRTPTEMEKGLLRLAFLPNSVAGGKRISQGRGQRISQVAAAHTRSEISTDGGEVAMEGYTALPAMPTAGEPLGVHSGVSPGAPTRPPSGAPSAPPQNWSSIEYGRPDLKFWLREAGENWSGKVCVFVCGPAGMRRDVKSAVAGLQHLVWDGRVDEVFCNCEDYAL
ncbi:hypothetical protein K470DRAFT_296661 [Piedraia hortae CBS 480.64]|uniref:ferric-chelate reductase (NADPH) n=1 Tax=Piedraia hortae CBS 480.64 TaxID=1314780 RepID=A0A6A7BTJ7_9PEZI|nr:hypothetical protein K470DRAFT_296661 [Piedraia hortae CBS 480.64]